MLLGTMCRTSEKTLNPRQKYEMLRHARQKNLSITIAQNNIALIGSILHLEIKYGIFYHQQSLFQIFIFETNSNSLNYVL